MRDIKKKIEILFNHRCSFYQVFFIKPPWVIRGLAFPVVYMDDWGSKLNRYCGGSQISILDCVCVSEASKLETLAAAYYEKYQKSDATRLLKDEYECFAKDYQQRAKEIREQYKHLQKGEG